MKVLVIDDEKEIAESTAEYFNMFDIETIAAASYEEGFQILKEEEISLLLLDINLGERSGFEFCKKLRKESSIPILFISARTSDDDVLTALNIGGDDYIKKPFSLNILLAKVKAMLKRCGNTEKEAPKAETKKEEKHLRLDVDGYRIYVDGTPVKLKKMELLILKYLMENEGRVVPKDELFEQVWPDQFVSDGTVMVHIRQLRKKIEKNPNEPEFLKTVWGTGYIYEE